MPTTPNSMPETKTKNQKPETRRHDDKVNKVTVEFVYINRYISRDRIRPFFPVINVCVRAQKIIRTSSKEKWGKRYTYKYMIRFDIVESACDGKFVCKSNENQINIRGKQMRENQLHLLVLFALTHTNTHTEQMKNNQRQLTLNLTIVCGKMLMYLYLTMYEHK